MHHPLPPESLFPANIAGISTRTVALSTGVNVRVAESGPPDGPPVLLIHGWGASLYMYRHALSMLPLHGLRAIAVDLPGYGLSDRPRARGSYSLAAYIADLDALFDAMRIPRAAVVGQSMGGGLALRYAQRRSERVERLVLINPTGLVPITWVWLVRVVPRIAMRALGERAIRRWLVEFILERIAYDDPSLVSERDIDEYWAPTQIPGYVHAIRASIGEFNWSALTPEEARQLAVPTAVVLGANDRVVRGAESAARRLNGAQVHVLAGGHCVHEEHPEVVYEIIGRFLTGP